MDRTSGRVVTARVGAKLTWSVSTGGGLATLSPLPDDLSGRACLKEDEVRYISERSAALESASGRMAPDVEWAVALDLPFPDRVYFPRHRPKTTWTTSGLSAPPAPKPGFDPVEYALRNVFKAPGR